MISKSPKPCPIKEKKTNETRTILKTYCRHASIFSLSPDFPFGICMLLISF